MCFCVHFFDQKIKELWRRVLEAFGTQNWCKIPKKSTEIAPQDGFFATLVSFIDFAHMFLIAKCFCKIFNLEKSVFCIGFYSIILTSVFSNNHARLCKSLDTAYLFFIYLLHRILQKINEKPSCKAWPGKNVHPKGLLMHFGVIWGSLWGPSASHFSLKVDDTFWSRPFLAPSQCSLWFF